MKKVILIVFIFTLYAYNLVAQPDNNYVYGKISQAEADLKEYTGDKNAEAVVLFDKGSSYFRSSYEGGFQLVYERTARVKVLSNAGVKYAEVEIPFYQEDRHLENIIDLEGITYNIDGHEVSRSNLKPTNIHDEKINNRWTLRKFVMPDVKPGSIFEFRYKIVSDFLFNLRDWEFQWRIPVVYSEYTVKMIPFYEYVWIFQGNLNLKDKKSYVDPGPDQRFAGVTYKNMIHEFTMENVPAFNDEEFITSKNDYISKLDFQLSKITRPNGVSEKIMTTWEEMNKELLGYPEFGKYITRAEKFGAKLPIVTEAKDKTEIEKFNLIVDYVKDNFSWDDMYGKYASKSLSDFVKEKTGNIGNINLFLVGLLRSAGLQASPVILSTRSHGKVKYNYPFVDAFNYAAVLTTINGKFVLADGTEPAALNYRLPIRAINDNGLIIQKGKAEKIGLDIQIMSESSTTVQLNLLADNSISANVNKVSFEYDALNYKKSIGSDNDILKAKFASSMYSIVDSTIRIINHDNRNKPYGASFSMKGNPEIINGKMYINPFVDLTLSQNPLKQATRLYPVDMIYPNKEVFTTTISIPDDWKIDYVPKNKKINNNLFELVYEVNQSSPKTVSISYSYTFKKGIYEVEEYSQLKFYFNEIVSLSNEKIILSKTDVAHLGLIE